MTDTSKPTPPEPPKPIRPPSRPEKPKKVEEIGGRPPAPNPPATATGSFNGKVTDF